MRLPPGFFAEPLDAVLERAGDFAAQLVLATAAFTVLMLLARALRPLVRRGLDRRQRRSYTRVFLGLYRVVAWLLSFLIAVTLAFPSVRVVDLLAGLGVLSVAAGFAFKDILENLLAGALLLLRDPFKSGDEIRIGDHEGIVEGITVRESCFAPIRVSAC
jgi:small conductance mechanosensitive channel